MKEIQMEGKEYHTDRVYSRFVSLRNTSRATWRSPHHLYHRRALFGEIRDGTSIEVDP